jgi:hypothetical protein
MNDHTQCPACHSPSTHVTKGEFKATGFQAFGNRVCNECGTGWRPACPRGVATVSIVSGFVVFGCALTVAGSSLAKFGFPPLGDAKDLKAIGPVGFLGVMGAWALFYGIAVLRGRAASSRFWAKFSWLRGRRLPTQATPTLVCAGYQRPVSPGGYCPQCGRATSS